MRLILNLSLLLFLSFGATAEDLPLVGLGHVGIRVSDIEKAPAFYSGLLGFDMAFDLNTPDGKALMLQYYKINDTQFLEVYPNLKADAALHITHVAFITDDIEKLHRMMEERGLKPGGIRSGRDGNKSFGIRPPPGQQLGFLEFTEYLPGSLHSNTQGKDMPARRISDHMQFAGILVTDLKAAMQFYQTMGFTEIGREPIEGAKGQRIDLQLPGKSKDYVELVDEPLPLSREESVRAEYPGFATPGILVTYKTAVDRGAGTLGPPRPGTDGKMQFGMLDPDGTLLEFRDGPPAQPQSRVAVKSLVTIYNLADHSKKVIYTATGDYQAPNWSPDGKYLLMNSPGKLWKLAVAGGAIQAVDTGAVKGINNDHGISKDGRWFGISAGNVYVLPSSGGQPREITNRVPSYFHGFSPDGRWLAFCAERNDNFDIYRIPFRGGKEQRLTVNRGYDDGPEYSPDGKWIYFNSDRTGSWDIWRMPAKGAGADDGKAEQITNDAMEDWFPHLSPDGKWLVMISFEKGVPNHPANKNVELRMMPAPGSKRGATPGDAKPLEIVTLFGGQGTMNVNSWSPDSKQFAYVSYELETPPESGRSAAPIGIFRGQSDVGNPAIQGSASFDPEAKEYRVTGAGANIWAKRDEFHFVWVRLSGDMSLTATMQFVGAGAVPHRKAGLMIRKNLEPGSPYVDAVVHGSGLTALQLREMPGGGTRGLQLPVDAPPRIRLERKGNLYTMWQGKEGGQLQKAASIRLSMGGGPVYVGLFLSSHNAKASETAVFSDVVLETSAAAPAVHNTN